MTLLRRSEKGRSGKMRKGRAPSFDSGGLRRGLWTVDEDNKLVAYIMRFGHGNWRALPKQAGLQRCGKSCRLRWINYLKPDIKRGNFTKEEEDTIIDLHRLLGNKWSKIASHLPGRTDNEIKNIWNTYLKKRITAAAASCSSHQLELSSTSDNSNKMMMTQVKNCEVSSLNDVDDLIISEIPILDDWDWEEVWGNSTAEISSSSDTIQTTTTASRGFCEEPSLGFEDSDDMWIEKLEKELNLWGSTGELLNDSD